MSACRIFKERFLCLLPPCFNILNYPPVHMSCDECSTHSFRLCDDSGGPLTHLVYFFCYIFPKLSKWRWSLIYFFFFFEEIKDLKKKKKSKRCVELIKTFWKMSGRRRTSVKLSSKLRRRRLAVNCLCQNVLPLLFFFVFNSPFLPHIKLR